MLEIWYGVQIDTTHLVYILQECKLIDEAEALVSANASAYADLNEICESIDIEELEIVPCGVCCKRKYNRDFFLLGKHSNFRMCERTGTCEKIESVSNQTRELVDNFCNKHNLKKPNYFLNSNDCYICRR